MKLENKLWSLMLMLKQVYLIKNFMRKFLIWKCMQKFNLNIFEYCHFFQSSKSFCLIYKEKKLETWLRDTWMRSQSDLIQSNELINKCVTELALNKSYLIWKMERWDWNLEIIFLSCVKEKAKLKNAKDAYHQIIWNTHFKQDRPLNSPPLENSKGFAGLYNVQMC